MSVTRATGNTLDRLVIAFLVGCVALACQSPPLAPWMANLGLALNAAAEFGDYEAADRLLQQARHEAEQLEGPAKSVALAEVLEGQAIVADLQGQQLEREQLLREALRVREAAELPLRPSLLPLCDALIQLDRFDEAQAAHERVLAIVKPNAQPHDWRVHQAYTVMAEAYRAKGLLERSIPFYQQASVARMYSEGSGRFDVATSLDGYALALEGLGRDEEARVVRDRAFEIVDGRTYTDRVVLHVYGANRFTSPMRWRRSQMPLDVFIEEPPEEWRGDKEELREVTRAAVKEWSDTVEPGVPAFEFTQSKMRANIVISWQRDRGEGWLGHSNGGRIRLEYTPLTKVNIEVLAAYAGGGQPSTSRVRQVVLHEIGHTLGLWNHSPYSRDLMYPAVGEQNPEITERDRDTLREIYQMKIRASVMH